VNDFAGTRHGGRWGRGLQRENKILDVEA